MEIKHHSYLSKITQAKQNKVSQIKEKNKLLKQDADENLERLKNIKNFKDYKIMEKHSLAQKKIEDFKSRSNGLRAYLSPKVM